jgi:signal transduction histidine kinase/CheY-like chemotaxis protein
MWRMYSTKSIAWSVLGLSVIPLVLLLSFVGIVGWLQAETRASAAAGQRSSDALLLAHRLADDIGGASTTARLYLLNGSNESYASTLAFLALVGPDARRLEDTVRRNPGQLQRAITLAKLAQSTVSEGLVLMHELHSGDRQAIYLRLIKSSLHKSRAPTLDDRFRAELTAFVTSETAFQVQGRASLERLWDVSSIVLFVIAASGIVLTLALNYTFGRRIVRRLRHLVAQTDDFAADESLNLPLPGSDEIADVSRSFYGLATEQRIARAAVQAALEKAVEASRLKSEFVATMSHEIRTPMNGVVGMTELLLETKLTPQQSEYAMTARDSAHSLLSVINNILDFSKIEAGKVELELVEFDLISQIESVGSMLGGQALAKQISLMTYVDASIPTRLLGDAVRLRQVLVNLAGNAIKFTAQGGVAVIADFVAASAGSVRVAFSVRDTGIGINPAVLPRLFESFTQADGSTTRRFGGTGLGLAISKQLVELMGGEIRAESSLGNGSTFLFDLDFSVAVAAAPRPRPDLSEACAIIIDDDVMSRDILSRYMSSWGIRVHTAATAEEGLRLLRDAARRERPFDIALVDLRMPEVDGLELGRRVRDDRLVCETKLLLVTAFDNLDQGRAAIEAGFSAYLTKPVRQSQLYDSLLHAIAGDIRAVVEQAGDKKPRDERHGNAILLVEDNEVNRQVTLHQLANLGYQAECVNDGRAAVARTGEKRFELIFMDCQMPIMDGFVATRAIRKRESRTGDHVPIVAMTANALSTDRAECFGAGMDDYLTKPVALNDLRGVLERWLDRPNGAKDIDIDRVVTIVGGDQMAAVTFLHEMLPEIVRLCDAIDSERNVAGLRELAHQLKGAAGNIGAVDLASAADRLGERLKSGDGSIDQEVALVADARIRFASAVRALLVPQA